MTMNEFADLWKKREKCDLNCIFENGELSFNNIDLECYIRVSTKVGFNIFPQKKILLKEMNWKKKKPKRKNNLSQMRKYHWREFLYNYESKRARKHL